MGRKKKAAKKAKKPEMIRINAVEVRADLVDHLLCQLSMKVTLYTVGCAAISPQDQFVGAILLNADREHLSEESQKFLTEMHELVHGKKEKKSAD